MSANVGNRLTPGKGYGWMVLTGQNAAIATGLELGDSARPNESASVAVFFLAVPANPPTEA